MTYLPAFLFIAGLALMSADAPPDTPEYVKYSMEQALVNLAGLALFGAAMWMARKSKSETRIEREEER